jgi:hypothetical protein
VNALLARGAACSGMGVLVWAAACTSDLDLTLEGKQCREREPRCLPGFVCELSLDRCVRRIAGDAGADGAGGAAGNAAGGAPPSASGAGAAGVAGTNIEPRCGSTLRRTCEGQLLSTCEAIDETIVLPFRCR